MEEVPFWARCWGSGVLLLIWLLFVVLYTFATKAATKKSHFVGLGAPLRSLDTDKVKTRNNGATQELTTAELTNSILACVRVPWKLRRVRKRKKKHNKPKERNWASFGYVTFRRERRIHQTFHSTQARGSFYSELKGFGKISRHNKTIHDFV